ncbi:MAG: hypothetical protein R2776_09850 [Flavobacteriaceae bacterium]
MKRIFITVVFLSLVISSTYAQDCFSRLGESFADRGAYPVTNGIHSHVFISFFEDNISRCVLGKVEVLNNKIVSIFLQYEDDTFELMDVIFYNVEKEQPTIENGISEMIYTSEGDKIKVVFIDLLKPKQE